MLPLEAVVIVICNLTLRDKDHEGDDLNPVQSDQLAPMQEVKVRSLPCFYRHP